MYDSFLHFGWLLWCQSQSFTTVLFTTMELHSTYYVLYRQMDIKNFLSKQINQDHNFRLSFISDYLICNHIHPIVYQGRWCNTMGHHDQFVGICCPPNADSHDHVGSLYSTVDICDWSEFRYRSHLNMILYTKFIIKSLCFTIALITVAFFPSLIWISSVAPWGIKVNLPTKIVCPTIFIKIVMLMWTLFIMFTNFYFSNATQGT